MYTLYHNPRCRKSREALSFLIEQGVTPQIREYLKEPLSKEELRQLLKQINLPPSAVVRKNEADWKALPNRKELNEEAILEALSQFPKIIERPIVTFNNSGVLARPLENLVNFFKVD